jgi:hypothetical protein
VVLELQPPDREVDHGQVGGEGRDVESVQVGEELLMGHLRVQRLLPHVCPDEEDPSGFR